MKKLFLAEKPDQGKKIAKELGSPIDRGTHVEANNGIVTWAFGHLFELLEPHEYDVKWEKWAVNTLPILPQAFRLNPIASRVHQLKAIGTLLQNTSAVVIATDSDREGELIAHEILDHFNYSGSVERLWLQSQEPAAIKKALANLRSAQSTETLHIAAEARRRADWLTGMNYTRAITLHCRPAQSSDVYNVGRVQTPTLALVVRRDRAIRNFKPRDYYELEATVQAGEHTITLRYAPAEEKHFDKSELEPYLTSHLNRTEPLKVEQRDKSTPPPDFFCLSGLQKAANSVFGWGADTTLRHLQELYETHQLVTYPRSDCAHLGDEHQSSIRPILANIIKLAVNPVSAAAAMIKQPIIRKSHYDSNKLTAHHAIIPTQVDPTTVWNNLSPDEKELFLLIASRYVGAHMPDYLYQHTEFTLTLETLNLDAVNRLETLKYRTQGKVPKALGWKHAHKSQDDDDQNPLNPALPSIAPLTPATIIHLRTDTKRTEPPRHYTERTLLDDMMSVGKYVTDPEVKKILNDTDGIGTEATRANILALLFGRNSKGEVTGKNPFLIATKTSGNIAPHVTASKRGHNLIEVLENTLPNLCDPTQTALWEKDLEGIVERKVTIETFLSRLSDNITKDLQKLSTTSTAPTIKPIATNYKCPRTQQPIYDTGTAWVAPGYRELWMYKNWLGKTFSVEEYLSILTNPQGAIIHKCISRENEKEYSPRLTFTESHPKTNKPGFIMTFDDAPPVESKATSVNCPKSGKAVQDCGTYWTFPGYPTVRCQKHLMGRSMSINDYMMIFSAGEAGHQFTHFISSRTTKEFATKLAYSEKAFKDRPGFISIFEENQTSQPTAKRKPKGHSHV